jgi:hypothetical protein
MHPSMFGELSVRSNPALSDDDQMYAAGYIEGLLTATRIYQSSVNVRCQLACDGSIPDSLRNFVAQNEAWVLGQVAANPSDSKWQMMGSVYQQYRGLIAGYRASDFALEQPMADDMLFWVINSLGDMFEILPAIDAAARPDYARMTVAEVREALLLKGHCSALVKVADDLSEIYAGHSSWFVYSNMLRIFKHYSFPLANKGLAAVEVSFSSYPGTLSSLDDFYTMSSGLIMLQTTNGVVDTSLYDQIQPESLLAWYRVRAANMLAHDGQEWGAVVDFHNSGTYNNQYMVVNLGAFTPGQALPAGTLWVVEQSVGLVVWEDLTETLRRGYWASFNVPAFPAVYELQGYGGLDARANATFFTSYDMAPRALIFRRDEHKAQSVSGFEAILRYNDYANDPFSGGSPSGAICSRDDLKRTSSEAVGCYDSKMTSASMYKHGRQAWALNGPTTEPAGPFCWSTSAYDASDAHEGMPDCYDFAWELFTPPTFL